MKKGGLAIKQFSFITNVQIPPEDYILIEYDWYMNQELGGYHKFALDDKKEIETLMCVINQIKKLDDKMAVYILAYPYETTDYRGEKSMYADCIWLNTVADCDVIDTMFQDNKNIQPSSIEHLKEMPEYHQEHFYLFQKNGNVVDLKKTELKQPFDNVKILYWD